MKNWKKHKENSIREEYLERVSEQQRARRRLYRDYDLEKALLQRVKHLQKRADRT